MKTCNNVFSATKDIRLNQEQSPNKNDTASMTDLEHSLPTDVTLNPNYRNEFPTNGKMALLSLVLAAKFGAFAFGNNELSGPEFSLIVNTVPIYTALASWLVLGEPVTREKAVACVVATVGIFTVCVPGAFESKEDNHWPW